MGTNAADKDAIRMASVPAEIKNRWLLFISKPPASIAPKIVKQKSPVKKQRISMLVYFDVPIHCRRGL